MKKIGPVAIVGAGLAGLSCAQALRTAGVEVRIFESGSVVGGRCATRLWQGHLVDHGVQYFTAQSAEFKKELLTRLRQFRPIISPILDLDEKVVTSPVGPRFYVLQGNNFLPHILSRGLDLRLNSPVEHVTFNSGSVECRGENYGAVVSGLPAPLTAQLFGVDHSMAEYDPCLVAMLEYADEGLELARQCYARLLPEGRSIISASYCENHKAGRIVGNKTVFVVQASPNFSREHAGEPPENYLPLLIEEHENLWHIPTGQCSASSIHCWPYARPKEETRQNALFPAGGFICGDSCAESTVEDVWLDGRRAANEVLAHLMGLGE